MSTQAAPMTDERLVRIEANHTELNGFCEECVAPLIEDGGASAQDGYVPYPCLPMQLVAEVRILRREVHLLNLSRGIPSAVGRD